MASEGEWLVLNMTGRDIDFWHISGREIRFEYHEESCQDQLTALRASMSACKDAGLSFDSLAGLALVTGPGNFTSIRIGLAMFRAIGFAAKCPVKGINLFEIATLSDESDAVLLLEARAGRVYVADKIGETLENYRILLRGEAEDYAQKAGLPLVEIDAKLRPFEVLDAIEHWRKSDDAARPFYLRPPDAAPSSYQPPKILDGAL